jgi:Na+/melibiose symporter-like transporter
MNKLPFRTKVAFGVGGAAEAIALHAYSAFAFFYYNQVHGVPGTLLGIAVLAITVSDAVTDPVIGAISDRWSSKRWGRRHPFMLASIIPIPVFLYLLFHPPIAFIESFRSEQTSHLLLMLWYLGTSSLLRFGLTIFHVPHLGMAAEIAKSYAERTTIMSYNLFFARAGSKASDFVVQFFFFATVGAAALDGQLQESSYHAFSTFFALVILAILAITCFATFDQIPYLQNTNRDKTGFTFKNFFLDMWGALKNRNYLLLLIAYFALSMLIGVRSVLVPYVNIFFWDLSNEHRSYLNLSIIGVFSAAFVATWLHVRYGKRAVAVLGVLFYAIIPAVPVLFKLFGAFPEDPQVVISILVVSEVLKDLGVTVLTISILSLLADLADEHEWKTGQRQEGIFYATRAFFAKLDIAVGKLFAGMVLDFIAIGTVTADNVALIPQEKKDLVGWVEGPLIVIPGIIAAWFYSRTTLSKDRVDAIRQDLEERRQAADRKPATATAATTATAVRGGGA